MDKIFFTIINIYKNAIKTGVMDSCRTNENSIEMIFLYDVIDLIIDGRVPQYLNFLIDAKLNAILAENKLEKETIEKLTLIKHLAPAIQRWDFDTLIEFSNNIFVDHRQCEIVKELNDLKSR